MKPSLLLLPNLLGENRNHELFLPQSVDRAVGTLDGLIAESEGGGRRFLSHFTTKKPTHQMPIAVYNKNSSDSDLDFFLEPIRNGERWGIVSDAGLPCVADPGSKLVWRARQTGIVVQPFVGPSSLFLALMHSGFSGQNFAFQGYLPRKGAMEEMQNLEKSGQTEIFIEAPHRNQETLELLVETLSPTTDLCVAWDLTLPTQGVLSQSIHIWRKSPLPNIHKKPAIFLIR